MTPHYEDESVRLFHGDCLDVLKTLPNNSVDSVCTDPPYGLADHTPAVVAKALGAWLSGDREHVPDGRGFMGRDWDKFVPPPAVFDECLRVLKPGGHLLSFAGSRTVDLMTTSVRFAGFEIRDSIAWLYGSGFPKSLDVSKAIDKQRDDRADVVQVTAWLKQKADAAGITRADVDRHMGTSDMAGWWLTSLARRCALPTPEQWEMLRALIGFGDEMDAEVARLNGRKGEAGEAWAERPDAEHASRPGMARSWTDGRGWTGTTAKAGSGVLDAAQQWQGWGTALKPAFEPIVVGRKPFPSTVAANVLEHGTGALNIDACRTTPDGLVWDHDRLELATQTTGRWPTNVALDESQAAELDKQTGVLTSGNRAAGTYGLMGYMGADAAPMPAVNGDSGGASRFFPTFRYEAKAPSSERPRDGQTAHPTVKPLDLMRWLVRLVTPPEGTVLDPFAGSGTTAEACVIEGFQCIAIEREADYLPLIVARLAKPIQMGFSFEDGGAA